MPKSNENMQSGDRLLVNASDVASIYVSLEEILAPLDTLYMHTYDEETLEKLDYIIQTIVQCSDKLIEMQMIDIDPDEIDYY